MGQRQALTEAIVKRYLRSSKADTDKILNELCATTGWASQPRPQGAGAGAAAEGGAAAAGAAADLRPGGACRAEVLLGGAGCADG